MTLWFVHIFIDGIIWIFSIILPIQICSSSTLNIEKISVYRKNFPRLNFFLKFVHAYLLTATFLTMVFGLWCEIKGNMIIFMSNLQVDSICLLLEPRLVWLSYSCMTIEEQRTTLSPQLIFTNDLIYTIGINYTQQLFAI